jgi:hypothetical protein
MESHGRRQPEVRMVAVLVCWKCQGRAGPNHYTLKDGGAVCGMCGDKNPLANLRQLPLGQVTAEHEIIINFGPDTHKKNGAIKVHALHLDCKTVLSHWQSVESLETLRKMMRYLGATGEQMASFEDDLRRWGQGSVHIRLLPNRRNLLKIDYSRF